MDMTKQLNKTKGRVVSMRQKKKVNLRELQELVGHLNFACRVVAPGCAFCVSFVTQCRGCVVHSTGQGLRMALERV